jgi:polysaccharide export outer membrane protein
MPTTVRQLFVPGHRHDAANRKSNEIRTSARKQRGSTALALQLVVASACGGRPPVVATPIPSAVVSHRVAQLDPALLAATVGEGEGDAYRLGPGDSLLVAVYEHPELSIAPYVPAGTLAQGTRPVGLLVDNDGTIQLPLVGSVNVGGETTDHVRLLLEDKLSHYIKEPRVTVQLIFPATIRYYLLGQFTNPGVKYSDRPLGLLEALSLGGTVDLERASLTTAYVVRGGKKLPVDFRSLVIDGDLTQNIRLRTGDVVVVPDRQNEQAFVFGGVAQSNPAGGAVPFVHGRLTLLQALARVGFGQSERFQGVLSDIHVIRSEGGHGELFIVDGTAIMQGRAASFDLQPGDVVYVPDTALATWDQAFSAIIPFLGAVAGVLQPFVQIKYLSGK